MKKVLLLVLVLALVAQVAVAATPQLQGERPGTGTRPGTPDTRGFGQMRAGLNARPHIGRPPMGPLRPRVGQAIDQARERFAKCQELAETDPAALKARMLERHDAMVARAQETLANKANLPAKIVADLKAAQARILAEATERAQSATDQAAAAKRLAALQERQARVLAATEKNAAQIAERMIKHAETVLANAAEIRARIEAGEGLDIIREHMQRRMEQMLQRRQNTQNAGQ